MTDPVPCHTDTAYMSVMIFGIAEKLQDVQEATMALERLVGKYLPNYYERHLLKSIVRLWMGIE